MSSIKPEEVVEEINFRSNSGTTHKRDLAEWRFGP
jgi:hypothetical protein